MANYFATLPAYNTGPGIDFSPVNNALDGITAQNNANRQAGLQRNHLELQQRQSDRADQEQQYQHGRNDKQDQLQQVQMFGKQAAAVDQMEGPQRVSTWQSILSRRGASNLTPEELDPITGPKLMMAQAGQFIDPLDRQEKQLGLQKTQAEINKLNTEAATSGEAYGKTGSVVQGSDGKYYSVQFGSRGQRQILPLELGGSPAASGGTAAPPVSLAPQRGVAVEGNLMYDKATGAPVRDVSANIAGGASAKEQGEAQGKAHADLPRQVDNAKLALQTIQSIRTHPGKEYGLGAYGVVPGIPGTEQRGFVNLVDQAKGQTFLAAFNSLRGGGQITEAEGAKATQALARLDRAQTAKDFDAALDDLQSVIQSGLDRATTSAAATPTTQAPASDWRSTFKRVE